MARSTQFNKHRMVRLHLAQIYDRLRESKGSLEKQEIEELKAAANVLKMIKEVLTIELEQAIVERLEALEDAIKQQSA